MDFKDFLQSRRQFFSKSYSNKTWSDQNICMLYTLVSKRVLPNTLDMLFLTFFSSSPHVDARKGKMMQKQEKSQKHLFASFALVCILPWCIFNLAVF